MKKVLVFGTFDSLHDGHRAMLREAKALSDYLIVVVAPDAAVTSLKGKKPHHSAAKRLELVKAERIADSVIVGDDEQDSWAVIKKNKPNTIALGYDQHELRSSLETYLEQHYPEVETEAGWQSNPKKPTIVILSPHKPDTYHNRILYS